MPNISPPTFEFEFRMKEVQRGLHSRSCPHEPYVRPPPDILALNVRVLESFQIGVIRGDPSKFLLVHWPRYGTLMALSAVSRF